MSIPATQLRPGMIIKHNNDLHSVFSVEHRTPGNLRAFIQAKLRNLRTGAMFEHRFRSPDPIEKINVDEQEMEFLYADGDNYYFMDTTNFEQTHLTRDILGDAVEYLIPNLQIKVEFFDGKAVGIELPQTVELTVIETEPGLKSATASSVTKAAKTETGLVVQLSTGGAVTDPEEDRLAALDALPGVVAAECHTVQGMGFSKRPRMTADDVVAASLAAFARGEVTCIPGLDDVSMLERLTEMQRAVLTSANAPALARRYRSGTA